MDSLISREDLFLEPGCLAIKVSPDGLRFAYVGANREGTMNLFLTSSLSLNDAIQVTHFQEPEIRGFYWSQDSQSLLLLKDREGTRQFYLYHLDVNTHELVNVTSSFSQVNARVFAVSQKTPHALIGLNHRNPVFHDLYLFDFKTRKLKLVYQNDHYINFVVDEDLAIVVKIKLNEDCSITYFDKEDHELAHFSPEDAFHSEALYFNSQEQALYLLDNRGCNTTQLKKMKLDKRDQGEVLGHDEKSDISSVIFFKGKPIAYSTYYMRNMWHVLDPTFQPLFDLWISKCGEDFDIVEKTPDGRWWILKHHLPQTGWKFLLYDKDTESFEELYTFPHLQSLSNMYQKVFCSRDGLPLVSYLTLPKQWDLGGKTEHPLPLVVIPHGGPFKARDYYAYSPFHQWLANRGYAVLSVNFRLSSGFGKQFVNAGNGQWGKKAHEDILDAVDACVAEKIADPKKLAIFGCSYGAYEGLASLTFSPNVFQCAVTICGPSHLKTVLDNVPFYWEIPTSPLSDKMMFFTKKAFIISMGGDPDKEQDLPYLDSCSPLNFVDRIQKPLLLVHGVNDPIVAVSESNQIYEKMKEKGCPIIYLSFPDEGHGIVKYANKMCYLAYSEWLFTQYLGGDFEPLDPKILDQTSAKIESTLALLEVFPK